MAENEKELEEFKRQAAEAAVDLVRSGMVVGLGHGSTAIFAVKKLAIKLNTGELERIIGIPCSHMIKDAAMELGIPLSTLGEHPAIDITIDGADEVDPELNLIKGGGGALLMEKRVARASAREIIVVDESKISPKLGSQFALPVEVAEIGWETAAEFIERLGTKAALRMAEGEPFCTDSGNLILDCDFGPIDNPGELDATLLGFDGVIDHGLFLGLATDVIAAGPAGLTHLRREES